MGGLKRYMPVTFMTMMIGTLAIAGIPPLAGFFSKDEILFRTFLTNKIIWTLGVVTALMTAFYMFRLMSMTFFGAYRGPGVGARAPAAVHARPCTVCRIRPMRTRTARRTRPSTTCRTARRRSRAPRMTRMVMVTARGTARTSRRGR